MSAPKTEGAEWLGWSLTSFNGSRYCNRDSPEAFLESYQKYKTRRKDVRALDLLDRHRELALEVCASLIGLR